MTPAIIVGARHASPSSDMPRWARHASPLLWLLLLSSPSLAADAKPSDYRGWKSLSLSNNLIQLHIVPDIGGRVIQLKLNDHEFLWVNPQLAGKLPPPTGLAPDGSWLNYGGDKLWPAPQGWDNDEQWPGPPDGILDGSPHTVSVLRANGDNVAVKLVSQKDPRTGIQFSRVIKISDGAAHVSFDSTMTNIDTKPRRWAIWQVTQINAANRNGDGYNKDIRWYSPLNPNSLFPRGYLETFGLVNNPSFSVDRRNNLVVGNYQRLVGKMGVDNTAGWVATVDGTAGYALVERFTYFPGQKYADDTPATFWMNGAGQIVAGNKIATLKDDPIETPHLVESEIVSPLATLKPGESYSFHLDWYATKIGGNYPILDCTPVSVTCEPFTARIADGKLHLAGRFGVFVSARLAVVFNDEAGAQIGNSSMSIVVSPDQPIVLAFTEPAPERGVAATLFLCDSDGANMGILAKARIQR